MALLIVTTAAHAGEPASTHATSLPCPNGPGVAVVAVDAQGNESWAGCWGADVPAPRDEDRRERTHQDRRTP
jgi:hypothetical protein